jgi:DNA-binding LacI/PurR family transcriptional regulator
VKKGMVFYMKEKSKEYIGIREIARLAEVSTATVSRVLNSPSQTSKEVQDKVLAIINEYNYVPNQTVKNLFSKTSNSIAIFIYDMSNPFFVSLIKETNKICFHHKYTLLICDTENNIEKEKESLKYCEAIRTKGIILTEGISYDFFLSEKCNQTIAFFDRFIPASYSTVASDNDNGIRMLIDYLYNLNHKKIAFAGFNENLQSSKKRMNAFVTHMKNKDLTISEEYIYHGVFDYKTGINAMDYFCSLTNFPTAVVCANDQIARGMIMRANKLNIKIPQDLSIVGFDGVDSTYFWPKITTIQQNIEQIAKNLFNLIVNPPAKPEQILINTRFIQGETCRKI